MERLAEKLKDILNEQDFCFEPWEIKVVEKALNRFVAYENTGLEPKEIQAIAGIASENCAKTADAIDKLLQDDAELESYRDLGPIDHLRELARANREGRCVVLPAPLGSQVWQFKYPTRIDENGEEWTICSVRKATVEPAPFGLTLSMVNQIGKIYWLSEEDALASLRREQE